MAFDLLLTALSRFGGVVIINYHTLRKSDARTHIGFLGRFFEFINHDEVVPSLSRRRRRPACFVTFDDGKASNFEETAPELRRLGVPAAFYVVTEFVTARRIPLWFDRVGALERRVPDLPDALRPPALKLLPHAQRARIVDDACRRYGVEADMNNPDVRPMSWNDARTLQSQGFTIGAHSEWHAILPREDEGEARADIAASLARVSGELNRPCRSFCFPNGNYTDALAGHALSCGAQTVLTTEPSWAGRSSPAWRLPRVQLFGGHGEAYIAMKLCAARLDGLLKDPDGSGRRYFWRRLTTAGR